MLQQIEELAIISVIRRCWLAGAGIVAVMINLLSDAHLSLEVGGILCLAGSLALLGWGEGAARRPCQRTELWALLEPANRPQVPVAQRIIGNILRDAYLRSALNVAWLAAGLLVASLLIAAGPGH